MNIMNLRRRWICVHDGNRSVLSRRSQIMRLCYLMPFMFIYLHKTPYYREILDRNIESEMYIFIDYESCMIAQ